MEPIVAWFDDMSAFTGFRLENIYKTPDNALAFFRLKVLSFEVPSKKKKSLQLSATITRGPWRKIAERIIKGIGSQISRHFFPT